MLGVALIRGQVRIADKVRTVRSAGPGVAVIRGDGSGKWTPRLISVDTRQFPAGDQPAAHTARVREKTFALSKRQVIDVAADEPVFHIEGRRAVHRLPN